MINCALGMVIDFVYNPGLWPPDLPLIVMIEFDGYQGPFITERLFTVTPISKF